MSQCKLIMTVPVGEALDQRKYKFMKEIKKMVSFSKRSISIIV